MNVDDATGGLPRAVTELWQADQRILTLHLDLTYRCDLDCVHCYLDNRTTWPEMTTAEWLSVLDQARDMGALMLVWSGGEVTARADFAALLAHASQLGFFSRVKTHGGNLDPAWVEGFAQSRVGQVDISIYSLRPAVHDAFTRVAGSLGRSIDAIRLLRAAGIRVRVNCFLQPGTIGEIAEIHDFFAELGAATEFHTRLRRDNAATTARDFLELSFADTVRADRAIQALSRAGLPAPISARADPNPCNAGRTYGYVSPDGEVWPCVVFPMALGNLREQSLADIWRGSAARQALVAWDNRQRATCNSCAGSGLCFYCPGDAYKHTGDFRNAPAHFHAGTRARMIAWEEGNGPTFDAAAWASVPGSGGRGPAVTRFVFPIHRARRSAGARVG